jgi:hypothetical protein
MSEQAVGERDPVEIVACLRWWIEPGNSGGTGYPGETCDFNADILAAAAALARLTEGQRIEGWAHRDDDGEGPREFHVREGGHTMGPTGGWPCTLTLHDEPRSGSER